MEAQKRLSKSDGDICARIVSHTSKVIKMGKLIVLSVDDDSVPHNSKRYKMYGAGNSDIKTRKEWVAYARDNGYDCVEAVNKTRKQDGGN